MRPADHQQSILIEPARTPFDLDLSGIWAHRELVYFLTLRDIKVRYKQTALGVVWVLLQPLLTAGILALVFSSFARFETTVPYPAFVLGGTLIWIFVFTAVSMTSGSFINNANLVTKVYFPRLIVPLASTLACIFDLAVSLPLLALVLVYYGIVPSWGIVLAPVFVAMAFIQAAAFGTLFSALNVRYRDVKFALPFFLQVWMLASPVFYPASMIPERWRLLFALNPLTGIVEGWRSAIFGAPFDWAVIGVSAASMTACTLLSVYVFRKMEDDFADFI